MGTNPLFTEWCAAVRKAGIQSLFLVERLDLGLWSGFITRCDGSTQEYRAKTEEEVLLTVVGWKKEYA